MPLPPALAAALAAPVVTSFTAVKLELPGRTLRLLDGSAELDVNGEAYTGADPDYGALGAVEAVSESLGAESPNLRLVLLPRTNAAAAAVASPAAQGSPVTVWVGVLDPATGATMTGDPIFVGELDTVRLSAGESRALQLEVASAWERLFDANEGAKLNATFWRSLHPDDAALDLIHAITQDPPWGSHNSRPSYVSAGPPVSNGGWGGGNDFGGGLGGGLGGFGRAFG